MAARTSPSSPASRSRPDGCAMGSPCEKQADGRLAGDGFSQLLVTLTRVMLRLPLLGRRLPAHNHAHPEPRPSLSTISGDATGSSGVPSSGVIARLDEVAAHRDCRSAWRAEDGELVGDLQALAPEPEQRRRAAARPARSA